MEIIIPHLAYTVEILDIKKAKGNDLYKLGFFHAITLKYKNKSIIYMKLPLKRQHIPVLAHELTHVIQNICADRDIDAVQEQEHCAYMMQYLLGKIMGYEYNV